MPNLSCGWLNELEVGLCIATRVVTTVQRVVGAVVIRRAIHHPVVGRAGDVRQLEARWGEVVPVPAAVCTDVVGVVEREPEVSGLMNLFRRYIQREAQNLKKQMVRVRFIGDRRRLDNKLVDLMDELELLTSENDLLHLTIALNYGGRDEVARSTKRLAYDVQKGRLDPKTIDEETLPKYLDTYVLPDPDLAIPPVAPAPANPNKSFIDTFSPSTVTILDKSSLSL